MPSLSMLLHNTPCLVYEGRVLSLSLSLSTGHEVFTRALAHASTLPQVKQSQKAAWL